MDETGKINIGRISGVSGVTGEVKLFHDSGEDERLIGLKEFFLREKTGTALQPYAIEGLKRRGKTPVLKLRGIDDRLRAEALIGATVWVDRGSLNPPGQGGFYAADIDGLSVVNTDGKTLGRVRRLLSNPAHDILEVEDEAGSSFLLPMVDVFVSAVEPEAGRVVVQLPEGLREATGKGGGDGHED